MTIETWLFVTAVLAACFVVASVAIFVVDCVYDKLGGRRR